MLEKIKRQYQYVISNSEYYKNKFKSVREFKAIEDFNKLPFTTKNEILSDQENYPPFGSNLCVSIQNIQRIHKTSGTTNKPVMIALTHNDIQHTVEVGADCFISSGLKRSDLVVHCLNYNMWAGGYTDHQSLERAGACVIPFGVGNSRKLLETILQLKVTAIHCTPSYLSKLEYIMKFELHLEPRDLNLRLGLFGAESGLQDQDFRESIEHIWGLLAMNANYGMSEVLSIIGAECSFQNGLHFFGEKALFPELLDLQTQESLPIEEGAVGELVLTNLYRESQPLIRYCTGDIIAILGRECECGSSTFRFEVKGRTDTMLVIRGLNLFPSNIEQIINKSLGFITESYQVLVNKNNPIDTIKLILEIKKGNQISEEALKAKVIYDFVEHLEITPTVEFVQEGALPRVEGKSQKILRTL
jgi:phenylacetate-CoA ligase